MKNSESMLVATTILFAVVLYVLTLFRSPKMSLVVRKNVYFDKAKLGTYSNFLIVVLLISAFIGYLISKRVLLTLEYSGLNLIVGAIAGVNLILYRKKDLS